MSEEAERRNDWMERYVERKDEKGRGADVGNTERASNLLSYVVSSQTSGSSLVVSARDRDTGHRQKVKTPSLKRAKTSLRFGCVLLRWEGQWTWNRGGIGEMRARGGRWVSSCGRRGTGVLIRDPRSEIRVRGVHV